MEVVQARGKASNHRGADDLLSGCSCPSILGDTILSSPYTCFLFLPTKPVSVDSCTCNQMASKISVYVLPRNGKILPINYVMPPWCILTSERLKSGNL